MSGFVISLEPPTKKQLKAQAAAKAARDAKEAKTAADRAEFQSQWDHGDIDARAMNHAHTMASMHAGCAIDHAVECGKLLLAKKEKMTHGEFMPWIEKHCKFKYSTAARYMTAARQSSTGVEISVQKHLSYLFPSGRPEAKAAKIEAKRKASPAAAPAETAKSPLPKVAAPLPIASPRASCAVEISAESEKSAEVPTGGRDADLDRVKAAITEYATAYGWGAAAMDLATWIEEQV